MHVPPQSWYTLLPLLHSCQINFSNILFCIHLYKTITGYMVFIGQSLVLCCLASCLLFWPYGLSACLHKFLIKNTHKNTKKTLVPSTDPTCMSLLMSVSCLQYSCHLIFLLVLTVLPFLKNLVRTPFSSYTIQSLVIISSYDLLYYYLAFNFATCKWFLMTINFSVALPTHDSVGENSIAII